MWSKFNRYAKGYTSVLVGVDAEFYLSHNYCRTLWTKENKTGILESNLWRVSIEEIIKSKMVLPCRIDPKNLNKAQNLMKRHLIFSQRKFQSWKKMVSIWATELSWKFAEAKLFFSFSRLFYFIITFSTFHSKNLHSKFLIHCVCAQCTVLLYSRSHSDWRNTNSNTNFDSQNIWSVLKVVACCSRSRCIFFLPAAAIGAACAVLVRLQL